MPGLAGLGRRLMSQFSLPQQLISRRLSRVAQRVLSALPAIAVGALAFGSFAAAEDVERPWWEPGAGTVLPAAAEYENELGRFGLVGTSGATATAGHAFFEPVGSNGRACVTCHQPADAMSISVATIRRRWDETDGKDPLFAPIDGQNCPHLPQADRASHSLLLDRGLIRVFLPWPPRDEAGDPIEPEFTLEVVRDPTGCNTHPEYGLNSANPMVSVYRRPRPAINLRYVTSSRFGVSPIIGKSGRLAPIDPETGAPLNMNMMADAREPTLAGQAQSAARAHLQRSTPLTPTQIEQIRSFELQLYGAQIESRGAGRLDEPRGPPALGPLAMANGRDGVLGNNTTNYVFPLGDVWAELPAGSNATEAARNSFRESVARGHDVYFFRTFWISDSMHINSVGLGNPIKRTCSTCHGMHMTAMDAANGWMDLGTTNLPWAREEPVSPWAKRQAEMPLFKLTCRADRPPHPFLGRVIYTQDPGRALISGRCDDIGAIVIQQFRGLAARAPYFSNGSAASLRELVDFYDRRYNIQYTEQEKTDLVNFLSVL
jgi:mono/diheme cytochrome c family protein